MSELGSFIGQLLTNAFNQQGVKGGSSLKLRYNEKAIIFSREVKGYETDKFIIIDNTVNRIIIGM